MAVSPIRLRTTTASRATRIRAVLAGCLVLGVGSTLTVAAWTDNEYAAGTFTAGTFSLVGSTDGATYAEHPSDPGATLNFQLPPTAMAPGDATYALYSVRTADSSVAGSVQLTTKSTNSSGLGAYLTYGVRLITTTVCNDTGFAAGTPVVPTGSPLTAGEFGTHALPAAGAAAVNYCFQVTLPSGTGNAAQGTSVTAGWVFVGTST